MKNILLAVLMTLLCVTMAYAFPREKMEGLYITCITGDNAPYPLKITVGQMAHFFEKKGGKCELEVVDDSSFIVTLRVVDKFTRKESEERMFFVTKDGAERAILTRYMNNGREIFGLDKNTILSALIGIESEKDKMKLQKNYRIANADDVEPMPRPDDYGDGVFSTIGTKCGNILKVTKSGSMGSVKVQILDDDFNLTNTIEEYDFPHGSNCWRDEIFSEGMGGICFDILENLSKTSRHVDSCRAGG